MSWRKKDIPQLQITDKVIDVSVVLVAQVRRVEVVEEAVEIPHLPLVKKIGVIPETIEIPQSLSDVRGVVQNIATDSGSSVGSTQQQHNQHRKQQRQQAGQTEEG